MYAYPMELTKLECTYLSDALSMFATGPPGAAEHGPYPELLLKVLSALLEAESSGGMVTVLMSQTELWLIREVAKSSVMVGSQPVGLSLLIKCARGLLAVTADEEVQGAVLRYGECPQDEPGKARYEHKLHDPEFGK